MTDLKAALALYRNDAFVILEVSPELLIIVETGEKVLEPITTEEVDGALIAAGLYGQMADREARWLLEAFMKERFGL